MLDALMLGFAWTDREMRGPEGKVVEGKVRQGDEKRLMVRTGVEYLRRGRYLDGFCACLQGRVEID